MESYPIHSIANAFQWIGMDTIAMDTYPFIAGTATGLWACSRGRIRRSPRVRARQTLAPGGFPARRGQANDGEKSPLHVPCEHPFAAR